MPGNYGPGSWPTVMIEQFLAHLAAETRAIANVPVVFIASLLILAGIVYVAMRWRYGVVISDLQERLELSSERVTEFCKKLNTESPDEAKARLDALEGQLAALSRQVPLRRLTDRQRVLLRDAVVRPVGFYKLEETPRSGLGLQVIDPANRRAMPDADRSGWVSPAEVAHVVAFLLSEQAAAVTGAAVPV